MQQYQQVAQQASESTTLKIKLEGAIEFQRAIIEEEEKAEKEKTEKKK
jgi:hypothetical protein